MPRTRRTSNPDPVQGPSSAPDSVLLGSPTGSYARKSTLSDLFILFVVPTNIIIPAIYLMMPALRALLVTEKLPGTKALSIAVVVVCSLVLTYTVPYFLFWLIKKAHQYKIIRIRKYTLSNYGLDNIGL